MKAAVADDPPRQGGSVQPSGRFAVRLERGTDLGQDPLAHGQYGTEGKPWSGVGSPSPLGSAHGVPERLVCDVDGFGKSLSIGELVSGIRAAANGEALVSPAIAAKVLKRLRAIEPPPPETPAVGSELSDRETQVLKLIANGKDNAQIAAELHISPKTVKNHISNILMKLQIDNRIQAAVFAVRSGIA